MNTRVFNRLVEQSFALINENQGRSKHFSWILDGNKPIAVGLNNIYKTHTKANRFGYKYDFIHSELDAIVRCEATPKDMKYFTLLNIRFGLRGCILLSRPCSSCSRLITAYGFRKVYFTDNEGEIVEWQK